jgi:hypothetical protein
MVSLCSEGCSRSKAGLPALPHLAQVPKDFGKPFEGQLVLEVHERKLAIPGAGLCTIEEPGCAKTLEGLQGRPLALDLDRELLMADLSKPLAALGRAIAPEELVCLLVSDTKVGRCIPFRPFSGEEFGQWLDAEEPVGKIRVVMRADGLEVVAARGKVPGPDRFGPSLSPVNGRPDFEGLDRLMLKLANRFQGEDDAGLVPSPSMKIESVARALAALSGPDGERFSKTFLVYP